MPLEGVTEELVQAAVLQLEREGRPIGLKTLRAHLGRGSFTTLKKHLDRILPRVDDRRRVPAPTGPAQAELDAVVRRVWSTAYYEASRAEAQAFAARTAALKAQRSRLANELQAIRDDARKLERRIARADAELRSMTRRLAGPPANRTSEPPTGNGPGRPTRPAGCEVNR